LISIIETIYNALDLNHFLKCEVRGFAGGEMQNFKICKNEKLPKITGGSFSILLIVAICFSGPALAVADTPPVKIASTSYVEEYVAKFVPTTGDVGYVLKKTDSGTEWAEDADTNNFQARTSSGNAGSVPVIGGADGAWGTPRGIDDAVTANSDNLVTSDAVNTAIIGVFIKAKDETDAVNVSKSHPNALVWVQ
jgi:hypothetical protein